MKNKIYLARPKDLENLQNIIDAEGLNRAICHKEHGCNICKVCMDLGVKDSEDCDAIFPLLKLLLKIGERFGQWDVKLIQEFMDEKDAVAID